LLLLVFTAGLFPVSAKESLIASYRFPAHLNAVKSGSPSNNTTVSMPLLPAEGINLRDYGAVGDNVTNDGPALQSALNALATQGGGTLIVPNGKYAILTPVSKDFLNLASAIVIRGVGSASQLRIATPTATTIMLGNLESLSIENLTFVGTPNVSNDTLVALRISSCLRATISNCNFYGIISLNSGGAIVYNYNSDVAIEHSAFRGCTGNSGQDVPVIQNDTWRGLSVSDVDFLDYGVLNGVYYSKTPYSAAYA